MTHDSTTKPGTYLKIVADSNDADYHTELNLIDSDTLEKLKPLIKAISKFKPYTFEENSEFGMIGFSHSHNWPRGEYCYRPDLGGKTIYEIYNQIDSNLIDEFDDEWMPNGNEGNIHTIDSIELIEVSKTTKLL
jgi:hypothetical protein